MRLPGARGVKTSNVQVLLRQHNVGLLEAKLLTAFEKYLSEQNAVVIMAWFC